MASSAAAAAFAPHPPVLPSFMFGGAPGADFPPPPSPYLNQQLYAAAPPPSSLYSMNMPAWPFLDPLAVNGSNAAAAYTQSYGGAALASATMADLQADEVPSKEELILQLSYWRHQNAMHSGAAATTDDGPLRGLGGGGVAAKTTTTHPEAALSPEGAAKQKWPKVMMKDKPRRALSAYSLFSRDTRTKLMDELACGTEEDHDDGAEERGRRGA
jgi:hypothetical protein